MNQGYIYSLLKYKHSALLGECLNLGILVYFLNENKLYFRYPNKVHRIKAIYDDVSERLIYGYLKDIERRIESINSRVDQVFIKEIESSFNLFIENYVLPSDSSSLQFNDFTKAIQYSSENSRILKYLTQSYFFELSESKPDKEYELGKRFYQSVKDHVKEVGKSKNPNFYKDYKIYSSTGVEFNFRYAWQNGSLNLVKPLNFDLSDAKYVARKAHKNYGLFVDLEQVAEKQGYRFDLIIGEPKKQNLFKEFDHSVKLLSNINSVNLIEEGKLQNYTSLLISSISD